MERTGLQESAAYRRLRILAKDGKIKLVRKGNNSHYVIL